MLGTRFATRLNSFASGAGKYWPGQSEKPSLHQMVKRASAVAGLSDVDLNCPGHAGGNLPQTAAMIADCALAVIGLAMRCYTNPAFKQGAFPNPDATVRREAIELTKRGIDATRAPGSNLMTLWLRQDGFDYSFQCDYDALWEMEVAGIAIAVLEPIELARKNGAKTIAVTNCSGSPTAQIADFVLCSTAQNAPLLGENATARIAQLNILDALFVAIAQRDRASADANLARTMAAVQTKRKA